MGTTYSIKINSNDYIDKVVLKGKIDEILYDLNMIFSTYDTNSEISIINDSFNNYYTLSKQLYHVLEKSLYYSSLSNGLYDPTVSPLVDLWGFGSKSKSIKPDQNSINNTKKNISYEFILLDKKGSKMNKINPNIYIDLSSIAKGYAVDVIAEYLVNIGYNDSMVEIGGELRCNGNNNNNNWIIGISNPISNNIYLKAKINNFSIATSGTYNNFISYNGIKYSHIINPFTGYPISNNILSCTVISKNCIDADALATMLMTMNYNNSINIINEIKDVECLIIVSDQSNNLKEYKSDNFNKYLVN